ncbi:MAG: DUF4258 domain-containing protein [Gaiellales bacterium]
MDRQFTDHADDRVREHHIAREAVYLTIAQPDREAVLNAGRWNESQHGARRFGDRELHVVWMRRHGELLVFTVWWKQLRRSRKGGRR